MVLAVAADLEYSQKSLAPAEFQVAQIQCECASPAKMAYDVVDEAIGIGCVEVASGGHCDRVMTRGDAELKSSPDVGHLGGRWSGARKCLNRHVFGSNGAIRELSGAPARGVRLGVLLYTGS